MPTDHALPPKYTPADVEPAITQRWLDADAFRADAAADADRANAFAICIPPPNVTAALHLGHALNNTLQDVLTRHARMQGKNAVWLPGTDHAGIATQTVVDKRLQASGEKSLKDYKLDEAATGEGREQFIAKVQAWKDEYEARITQQLKEMGCSCDWSRQAFTMDEPRAKAVREAFFQLFKDGLIYRGKRLVNWDPVTQTALADDEVEMHDVDGQFYYMKYPVVEKASAGEGYVDTGEFVTVATTRPETMLGDTAVAVNPNDAPRARFVGRFVRLPIVNRIIPIIADDYVVIPDENSDDAKAKMASGFLKVTPAHDPNDYDIGQRHSLPIINVMAPDASISRAHGWPLEEWESDTSTSRGRQPADAGSGLVDPFAHTLLGQSREDARRAIVRWFKEHDLLAEQRPYRHAVGHSYRSHVPVEPYYSDQWYLRVTDDRLAGAALRAMATDQRSGEPTGATKEMRSTAYSSGVGMRFTPGRYAKTFQNWHENIRDWCISRQLWWGHRIPVWSGPASAVNELPESAGLALQTVGDTAFVAMQHDNTDLQNRIETLGFTRDPDVLDTWFSSALWPMSTLGWPDQTPDLELWNPTSVLCTAREIITLWVSRMVMFNLYFLGRLPFKDVFIHAMIQDGHGQKMSKSLGNGVDPVDIIHSHGSDAMRFTLTQMTTQTQDVRLPVDLIDPVSGETFAPKFITGPGGYKVAAPIQEHPPGSGRKMVSSYGLASGQATPTAELPLARNTSEKFDIGQRFATKLWNATRFALGYLQGDHGAPKPGDGHPPALQAAQRSLADRWILARTAEAVAAADKALAEYDFHRYATGLYEFAWNEACDWYIEAVKPQMAEDSPAGASARQTLAAVLDTTLRLLHPVMPFITERLWEALNVALPTDRSVPGLILPPGDLLVKAAWPRLDEAHALADAEALRDFDLIREITRAVREVRAQYKIAPGQTLELSARVPAAILNRMMPHRHFAETLANYRGRDVGPNVEKPAQASVTLVGDMTLYVHDIVDTDAERQRLTKALEDKQRQVATFEKRLSNDKYVSGAPAALVQETRDGLAGALRDVAALQQQLSEI